MDIDTKLDEWNVVKKRVSAKTPKGWVKNGAIYWVNIGYNVGIEVFGKGNDFTRPVLVLNKLPNGAFLGVPLSSKLENKTGFMFFKFLDSSGAMRVALLGQIRVYDAKRVSNLQGKVNARTFSELKQAVAKNILKCPCN